MFTQEQMKSSFLFPIDNYGILYAKKQCVLAKPAVIGQTVTTITGDGVETVNTAKENDYIVQNQTEAKELYLLNRDKLFQRYQPSYQVDDGWVLFKPTGKVKAIVVTDDVIQTIGSEFIAPWGEPMKVAVGDMLCVPYPNNNEVYRIAKKEFEETYEVISCPDTSN